MSVFGNIAKTIAVLLIAAMTVTLASCGGEAGNTPSATDASGATVEAEPSAEPSNTPDIVTDAVDPSSAADDNFTKFDLTASYDKANSTTITLSGSSATVTGKGASASGSIVTITAGGTYILSGSLSDGQIIVELAKTDKAQLVFDNVSISNSQTAPIYIKSADKVAITLAPGSVNTLSDAKKYTYTGTETKPNACLYSSDDLSINGTGSLTVTGNSNNGIGCKNDLKLVSGDITVSAPNNAIKGNDSVSVRDAKITISLADDGIKSDNETDAGKGFILIVGGELNIVAEDDALQAFNRVTISGGKVTVTCGGQSVNCNGITDIAEGCLIEK